MKKTEIKIGACYINKSGRVIRKVLDRGDYPMYDGQDDHDCILYEIVRDGTKSNSTAGKTYSMTATSFAAWARAEISEDGKVCQSEHEDNCSVRDFLTKLISEHSNAAANGTASFLYKGTADQEQTFCAQVIDLIENGNLEI